MEFYSVEKTFTELLYNLIEVLLVSITPQLVHQLILDISTIFAKLFQAAFG
jgi:hypothetical protein